MNINKLVSILRVRKLEVSVGRGTPGVGPRIRVDFFALPTQPCQLLTLNDFKNVMVVAL